MMPRHWSAAMRGAFFIMALSVVRCEAQDASDAVNDRIAPTRAAQGEVARADTRVSQLMLEAHRARVEAELAGREDISLPTSVQNARGLVALDRVIRDEEIIFRSRRNAFLSQLQGYRASVDVSRREIQILKDKDFLILEQIPLLSQQLDNVRTLLERGSASVNQKLVLAQALAQYKTAHLDLQLAILKATQEYETYLRNMEDIANQRQTEITMALTLTEDKLADLSRNGRSVTRDASASAPKASVLGLRGTDGSLMAASFDAGGEPGGLKSQRRP